MRAERTAQDLIFRPANKYVGRRCDHCGGTLRYISNNHCVDCKGVSEYSRVNSNRARAIKRRVVQAYRVGEGW